MRPTWRKPPHIRRKLAMMAAGQLNQDPLLQQQAQLRQGPIPEGLAGPVRTRIIPATQRALQSLAPLLAKTHKAAHISPPTQVRNRIALEAPPVLEEVVVVGADIQRYSFPQVA